MDITEQSGGKHISPRETELFVFRFQWSDAYLIDMGGEGTWTATRRDDGRVLTAPGPDELHEAIISDCIACGMPAGER